MKEDSKQPIISIVTCTFNAEQTLEATLSSVSMQDYQTVEHIIMDGRSSDSTVAIAECYRMEMMGKGRKVVVVSEPDSGLYHAMNKALQLCTGRYVVFLNAGDRLHAMDTLSRVAAVAAESGVGVVYGQTDIVDSEGHFLRHRRLQAPQKLTWQSFRMGMVVCHQAFYACTDIARQTLYDTRLRFSADVDWCIRIMRQCENEGLTLLSTDCVVADFMDGGMTTANHKASLIERFRVMHRHYGLVSTIIFHIWFAFRAIAKGSKA